VAHETQVIKNEYEMKLSAAFNLVEELENKIEISNSNSKKLIEENLLLNLQLKFMDKEFNDQGDFLNDKMSLKDKEIQYLNKEKQELEDKSKFFNKDNLDKEIFKGFEDSGENK